MKHSYGPLSRLLEPAADALPTRQLNDTYWISRESNRDFEENGLRALDVITTPIGAKGIVAGHFL